MNNSNTNEQRQRNKIMLSDIKSKIQDIDNQKNEMDERRFPRVSYPLSMSDLPSFDIDGTLAEHRFLHSLQRCSIQGLKHFKLY